MSTSAATTFRYLGATHFGSPSEVLKFGSLDSLPELKDGSQEILIGLEYAELNPVDMQKLAQKPGQAVPQAPLVVGYGGSGTVLKVADSNSELKMGDAVVFLADPRRSLGAYATHIVCDAQCVSKLPVSNSVSMKSAATVPLAGCTALESLQKLHLHDERVSSLLIIGGAGGVGSWATRLALALYPNLKQVICTASSETSRDACLKGGATSVVMPHEALLEQLEGGRSGSVDRILCLTEPTQELWKSITEVIRPYGIICLVVAGASIQSLDMGFLFFKSATVTTETVFSSQRNNYSHTKPKDLMNTILALITTGQVQPPLNKVGNWKESLQEGGLLDQLGSGHVNGKLVMKID